MKIIKQNILKPIIKKIEYMAFNEIQIDRIIEMAWEDRTPFDAIKFQFGLSESDVKAFMKKELKFSSYKLWRSRVEIRTGAAFVLHSELIPISVVVCIKKSGVHRQTRHAYRAPCLLEKQKWKQRANF